MNNKLEIFKKLITSRLQRNKRNGYIIDKFVNKYIDTFDENHLLDLEKFLIMKMK